VEPARPGEEKRIADEHRHKVAVCLWQLRKGIGVETTCKGNGWNRRSIWNSIAHSPAYQNFRQRRNRKWPQNRINHRKYEWVSRRYPLEGLFLNRMEEILREHGILYDREPRVKAGMCRADFRTPHTLIECKTDVTTMGLNKALGQCWIYKAVAGEDCIIVMPDDVHPRYEWLMAFEKMGVRVFSESSFVQMLSGCLPLDGVTPRELTFLRSKKR
jgi:hypothetical protein